MNAIANWLRIHGARVHESTPTEHHSLFSPDRLFLNASLPPVVNKNLLDFVEGCDWTLSCGRQRLRYGKPFDSEDIDNVTFWVTNGGECKGCRVLSCSARLHDTFLVFSLSRKLQQFVQM